MMGTEPALVLRQMAELTRQALAADSDTLEELELPDDGLLIAAPEEPHSGPTPASLVFSIGAVGAAWALGPLGSPPAEPEAYRIWHEQLLERLRAAWGEDGSEAVRVIGRCLQHDPFDRPHPKHLVAELDPSWTPASRSRGHTYEPSISSTPRAVHTRTEQRLSWMIVAVLTLTILLLVGASFGLGALYLSEPERAQAPVPVPVQAQEPVTEPVAEPVPEPEPAPVPVPVPVPGPAPAPPPVPDVQNDLIDPWE
jgi:hypothetical protein